MSLTVIDDNFINARIEVLQKKNMTANPSQNPQSDRKLWLLFLEKVVRPVFANLAADRFKQEFPVSKCYQEFAHLEAFARSLSGIAYWLKGDFGDQDEIALRGWCRQTILEAISNGTDPARRDFFDFKTERQPLVDTAYFAKALLQAPEVLWSPLSSQVQSNVIEAFKTAIQIKPWTNNYVLFNSMIELALWKFGVPVDFSHTEFALRTCESWYLGDGTYSDGLEYRCDYYNSIAIQPFILNILDHYGRDEVFSAVHRRQKKIATRYAAIQERMIAPDGSYPPLGRSITYRLGVFHHLAEASYRGLLPPEVSPNQVRSALTAVLKRFSKAKIFTDQGWLQIGLVGPQPRLGEHYISHGSLYMVCAVLPILGLKPESEFWSGPEAPWTSIKIWNGEDLECDKPLKWA